MNHLNKLLLILTFGFLCTGCNQKPDRIIGIKIYDYKGDFSALAAKWYQMGINTAFISTNLAANDTFREALKKKKMQTYIIFQVFQNPEVLRLDSSLYAITNKGKIAREDWVEFVCPSRVSYRKAKVDILGKIIQKLNPDGISIDFIRQFVFWEMIYPDRDAGSIEMACFCDSCLSAFSKQQHISIPDTCLSTSQKANYVLMNYSEKWNTFRCDLIATMVKELADKARQIKPGLKINVHIVPWREDDFGGANIRVATQDLQKISKYTNYISPMCYSQMLKRDAGWISDVVTDMDKRAPGMVLPGIQVYPYYIDQSFTAKDFKLCIEEALKPPSKGVVFFSWPLFEKDSIRMEVVREALSSDQAPY